MFDSKDNISKEIKDLKKKLDDDIAEKNEYKRKLSILEEKKSLSDEEKKEKERLDVHILTLEQSIASKDGQLDTLYKKQNSEYNETTRKRKKSRIDVMELAYNSNSNISPDSRSSLKQYIVDTQSLVDEKAKALDEKAKALDEKAQLERELRVLKDKFNDIFHEREEYLKHISSVYARGFLEFKLLELINLHKVSPICTEKSVNDPASMMEHWIECKLVDFDARQDFVSVLYNEKDEKSDAIAVTILPREKNSLIHAIKNLFRTISQQVHGLKTRDGVAIIPSCLDSKSKLALCTFLKKHQIRYIVEEALYS